MSKILAYIHNTPLTSSKANLIQVFHMCNAFQEHLQKVYLLLPEAGILEEESKAFILERHGIEVSFEIKFYPAQYKNRVFEKYLGTKNAVRLIKKIEIDCVFTRLPVYIKPVIKQGINFILESHNNKTHNKSRWVDFFWKKVIKSSISKDEFLAFITISENLRKYWLGFGLPEEKILALHDGIDTKMFENLPIKKESYELLGLDESKPIVVYTGSLYKDRGIENIIELAYYLPEAFFCVVGGPEESRMYYEQLAKESELDNIRFFGRKPYSDIPYFLSVADVLLALWSRNVPTIEYCSPLKLFEYMAAGKTIVAHEFTTIREVIIDGKNGLLANPDSFKDLLEKTKFAIKSEDSLGVQAKKDVFEKYTWNKRVEEIIEKSKLHN